MGEALIPLLIIGASTASALSSKSAAGLSAPKDKSTATTLSRESQDMAEEARRRRAAMVGRDQLVVPKAGTGLSIPTA